uniref:ELMO domain-containing protein n=1 Tax=Strigamia maritima TaxID=126957 RepID=T1J981_STRMM
MTVRRTNDGAPMTAIDITRTQFTNNHGFAVNVLDFRSDSQSSKLSVQAVANAASEHHGFVAEIFPSLQYLLHLVNISEIFVFFYDYIHHEISDNTFERNYFGAIYYSSFDEVIPNTVFPRKERHAGKTEFVQISKTEHLVIFTACPLLICGLVRLFHRVRQIGHPSLHVNKEQTGTNTAEITGIVLPINGHSKGRRCKVRLNLPSGQVLKDCRSHLWILGKPIGAGYCAEVYAGSNVCSYKHHCSTWKSAETDGKYAIKIALGNDEPLNNEMNFYLLFGNVESIAQWREKRKLNFLGMPRFFEFGTDVVNGTEHFFIVMARMGNNLQELWLENGKILSPKTVINIGIQILNVLEYIHNGRYVHNDVKPSNILVDPECCDRVYLVDFGAVFVYKNWKGDHATIKPNPEYAHFGTLEFTARDSHLGRFSRRADLEMLAYTMLKLSSGKLPWEAEATLDVDDYEAVEALKIRYFDDLTKLFKECYGDAAPCPGLEQFFDYVVALGFEETPNYASCCQFLKEALAQSGYKDDGKLGLIKVANETGETPILKRGILEMPKLERTAEDSEKLSDGNAQLIEFDQKRPLAAIIQDLCNVWTLSEPEQYSLQFSDTGQNYITEKNRNEIKNGSILRLTPSPTKIAGEILEKLNSTTSTTDEKKEALIQLAKLATDNTFCLEFVNQQGSTLLISLIEDGVYLGESLSYTLSAFVEIMDHGNVSWDNLEPKFINKVASYVNNPAASLTPRTVKASLSILESLVLNSSKKYTLVDQEVTLPNLIMHLQSTDGEIQQNAIALINALFLKADENKRKAMAGTLSSRQIRNVILNSIIQGPRTIGAEMAHQLYVLQSLLLNLLEDRKMTKMDPQDSDDREKILELRKIAFDNDDARDVTSRRPGYAKDYKKLGFQNHANPAEDFTESPPGMLALDNMIYFARYHADAYTKVVLENSCRSDDHECPFGETSIGLTKLLCEILKIGEPPSEQGQTFYPMFFTHDHAFEEFFCICVMLLNKTWKEMRATKEDLRKVFSVVKEQISRALSNSATTLDKFRNKLNTLTYSEITNLWQQERTSREEWESQARPIVELRCQITPEIMELIQQQRLGYLVDGTMFTKYTNKGQRIKDKFWYCRLSPNHKTLHYGDCEENTTPTLEELSNNKLPVVDIKALVTGKECPHMKDVKGKKSTWSLAFSLLLDSEMDALNFVAPNERVYDYWTDGINALLGNQMLSKEAKSDLETLLSMDIKLRLLDTEGVKIPEEPPSIPKDPPNFDFCYDFK